MDPESDLDTWTRVLEAVQEQARQRQEQRDEWEAKLEGESGAEALRVVVSIKQRYADRVLDYS